MSSYLYSLFFGPQIVDPPVTVNQDKPPEQIITDGLAKLEPTESVTTVSQPKTIDLLDYCNRTYLEPKGFVLRQDSPICYQLRNAAKNESHLLYIKPICYPNSPIQYEIANRETCHPHIQTLSRLQDRFSSHNLPIFVSSKRIKFGTATDSCPVYLCIKDATLVLTNELE